MQQLFPSIPYIANNNYLCSAPFCFRLSSFRNAARKSLEKAAYSSGLTAELEYPSQKAITYMVFVMQSGITHSE